MTQRSGRERWRREQDRVVFWFLSLKRVNIDFLSLKSLKRVNILFASSEQHTGLRKVRLKKRLHPVLFPVHFLVDLRNL